MLWNAVGVKLCGEKIEYELSGLAGIPALQNFREPVKIRAVKNFYEIAYLAGELHVKLVFSAEIVAYCRMVEIGLCGDLARARSRERPHSEFLEGGFEYARLRVIATPLDKLDYVILFSH